MTSRHLYCVTFYTSHLQVTQQALSDKTPARCKRGNAIDERSRAFNSKFCTGFGTFSKPIRFEVMLFFLVSSKVFSPLQAKFLFQDFMAVKQATAVFRNPAPASSCTKLPRIGKLVTSLTSTAQVQHVTLTLASQQRWNFRLQAYLFDRIKIVRL